MPPEPLADTLHRHDVASLRRRCEIIRDAPIGDERLAQAHKQIRGLLVRQAVRDITQEERAALMQILAFALPLPEQRPE